MKNKDDNIKNLKKALDYAIEIIEAYEYDCKHLDEYLRDNDPKGFCQGKVYKNALTRIRGNYE